jgi:hypothetical protein
VAKLVLYHAPAEGASPEAYAAASLQPVATVFELTVELSTSPSRREAGKTYSESSASPAPESNSNAVAVIT